MRSSQFLLCILFIMISIMENKDVHRKTTKENLAEVRMRIEDIKEKLKSSATLHNRNKTQISEYKEMLIKLVEEMNDIQHGISQKRKEDNESHKLSSLTRTNMSQDLLNKSIDEYPINETVSNITVKTYENRIDRWDSFHPKRKENLHDTTEKKPEYVNQSHKADTVQDLLNESVEGEILNETNLNETKKTRDNNIESREQIDTSSLFSYPKTSEYLYRRPERRPVLVRVPKISTQKSYEEPGGFLEEEKSHSDKKQINAVETDVRTTKSKKTNHYFISKLKNRLQFLENSFHDIFIHENTEHNCSKHDIKHTTLPKISESDLEENDKTWYEQEKDNGSSDYSYHNHYMHTNRKPTRNKCLTFNSNDLRSLKRNHEGINEVNHHNLENFSDIKEFDEKLEKDNSEYGRRVGDKHKYIENKVDMAVYKGKCNEDSINESHQFHQEKDFHKKSENFKGVSDVNNEHDISNEELLNPDKSNSENHLNDETSDLNFLLEEVDDTNYGDDSTITESKGERTNQSIEKESNVNGSSTLYLKKNLFYRRKSSNHSREKTVRANINRFTKMRQSLAPEMTNDKAQSSTRVVCTIFAKPLLRNIENEVFEKTPQSPAIAVGLALMCLLTFLSILAAVQFTTNFLVNDPRAKNIFLFHGK